MPIKRIRQCPRCGWTGPAGELKLAAGFGSYRWGNTGWKIRRCPQCGKTGRTEEFVVVHDE